MDNLYHYLLEPQRLIKLALIFLLSLVLLSYFSLLLNIFSLLFWSYFLAYLIEPLVEWLESKGLKRTWAIIMLFLTLFIITGLVLMLVIPRSMAQINEFVQQAPDIIKRLYELSQEYLRQIQQISMPERVMVEINNNIDHFQTYFLQILGNMTTWIGEAINRLIIVLMIPVLSFYILRDKDKIDLKLYYLMPSVIRVPVIGFMRRVDVVLGAWIRGQILVSLFIFGITLIALAAVGMKFALLLAIFSGITNIIPYFGPIIGAIPGVIIAGFQAPNLLWRVIIVYTIVQQIENSFVSPVIIGNRIGLPPAIIMISLLVGGQFGGIVGLIFAAPIAAILNNLIEYLVDYRTQQLEYKIMNNGDEGL